MLRRQPKDKGLLDAIDLQLLEGVDRGLTWSALVQSTKREADEAVLRIMRLIQQGYLEGKPGDDSAPPSQPAAVTPAPPASASFAGAATRPVPSIAGAPSSSSRAEPRASTASSTTVPPRAALSSPIATSPPQGKTLPPNALAAREALLRELATRRSGASFAPVSPSMRPGTPTQGDQLAGYYSMRPSPGSGSSTPPGASVHPSVSASGRSSSVPPGRYSLLPDGGTSSAPPGAYIEGEGADSGLAALIDEFARGSERDRWCAARLHEAREQERAGELQQAIGALQLAMSQNSDLRIRAERDRLQARSLRAVSGVYRTRALSEERANRLKEAAESWRKVLEACPDDVEAAIHAATCCMEIGEVKQAGQLARRAVELSPESVLAHRLMLRFFRKTGMELNANREREILRKLAKY